LDIRFLRQLHDVFEGVVAVDRVGEGQQLDRNTLVMDACVAIAFKAEALVANKEKD